MRFVRYARVAIFMAGVVPVAAKAAPTTLVSAAPVVESVAAFVTEASRRFAIPEAWIYAEMRVESAGNPRALSRKGATGLMQIMPGTWAYLRGRYGLGGDIHDARDNIMAGAAFLREMYDRYGSPAFLAAYNAGPGRYESHLATGRPLPPETVAYVSRLAPMVGGKAPDRAAIAASDPRAWTRAGLFAGRSDAPEVRDAPAREPPSDTTTAARPTVDRAAAAPSAGGLFVPLSGRIAR